MGHFSISKIIILFNRKTSYKSFFVFRRLFQRSINFTLVSDRNSMSFILFYLFASFSVHFILSLISRAIKIANRCLAKRTVFLSSLKTRITWWSCLFREDQIVRLVLFFRILNFFFSVVSLLKLVSLISSLSCDEIHVGFGCFHLFKKSNWIV